MFLWQFHDVILRSFGFPVSLWLFDHFGVVTLVVVFTQKLKYFSFFVNLPWFPFGSRRINALRIRQSAKRSCDSALYNGRKLFVLVSFIEDLGFIGRLNKG